MNSRFSVISAVLLGLLISSAVAADKYPPVFEGAKSEVYKQVGDTKLQLYIFNPANHNATNRTPAIVFFFGGGWSSGNPKQFEQHCRYLASRGMVAITADYRVASRHGVKAVDCVIDAQDAVRWIRVNAARLGVDPDRLAAGGGSAGGHLAGAVGTLADLTGNKDAKAPGIRPNALVLYNPALVLAPVEGEGSTGIREPLGKERLGVEAAELSPAHHVSKGNPPTIIFHGKADTTVPYVTAEVFAKRMKAAGNRCELVGYEGKTHGFFNYGRDGNASFLATLKQTDEFLASFGYLKGKPTVDVFFAGKTK
ncbi:MAG TPA: alpha/beta hydrolase [Roseimicrobium sp.]|nr:alpha/beta hydrolase [Roseimicrobium sp.]